MIVRLQTSEQITYFSKFVSWQFVNVKAQLPFLIISHGRNFRFIVCVQWRMCRSCRCVVFGFFGSSLFRRFFPSGATTCFGLKKRFVILKTGKSTVSKQRSENLKRPLWYLRFSQKLKIMLRKRLKFRETKNLKPLLSEMGKQVRNTAI